MDRDLVRVLVGISEAGPEAVCDMLDDMSLTVSMGVRERVSVGLGLRLYDPLALSVPLSVSVDEIEALPSCVPFGLRDTRMLCEGDRALLLGVVLGLGELLGELNWLTDWGSVGYWLVD